MPLPPPAHQRTLKHTRTVAIEVFSRDDGLWEIDARLTDTKTYDIALTFGSLPANKPIHDMWLRVTVDAQSNIVDAESVSDAVPYPGYCDTNNQTYKKLIGLNLLDGFRKGLRERLSGIEGCTHINELAAILPTAAIQTFAFGDMEKRTDLAGGKQDKKPFELDNCHALRTDGPTVALYYPRWFVEKPG